LIWIFTCTEELSESNSLRGTAKADRRKLTVTGKNINQVMIEMRNNQNKLTFTAFFENVIFCHADTLQWLKIKRNTPEQKKANQVIADLRF